MPEDYKKEIEAIETVISALGPLEPKARDSVIEYVLKRLDIKTPESFSNTPPGSGQTPPATPPSPPVPPGAGSELHIKTFKEEKKPISDVEMVTLVGYYLAYLLPESERKEKFGVKDVDTYLKIAEYKLPAQIRFTLSNAKNAGYLEHVGNGEYRLNPVGYNLIAHSLPKSGQQRSSTPPKKRKAPKKKAKAAKKAKKKSK